MNNEIQKPNIADFISTISKRQIGIKDKKFVYLDTKKEVEQDILDKAKTMQNEQYKSVLKNELENLCSQKEQGAKNYIAQNNVSHYLLAEYARVDEALKANNVEFFEAEAKLLGTTAQEEFDKAKATAEAYKTAYNNFLVLIRSFRRKTSALIDNNELDKAKEVIEKAQEFGADTSIDDVAKLFKGVK